MNIQNQNVKVISERSLSIWHPHPQNTETLPLGVLFLEADQQSMVLALQEHQGWAGNQKEWEFWSHMHPDWMPSETFSQLNAKETRRFLHFCQDLSNFPHFFEHAPDANFLSRWHQEWYEKAVSVEKIVDLNLHVSGADMLTDPDAKLAQCMDMPEPLILWLETGYRTPASDFICSRMFGVPRSTPCVIPRGYDSFSSCIAMLRQVPMQGWKENLAQASPEWQALLPLWDRLSRLLHAWPPEKIDRQLEVVFQKAQKTHEFSEMAFR